MTIIQACDWVIQRLIKLDCYAPRKELEDLWNYDLETLDEALILLRNDGTIACTNGVWWIRKPPVPFLKQA